MPKRPTKTELEAATKAAAKPEADNRLPIADPDKVVWVGERSTGAMKWTGDDMDPGMVYGTVSSDEQIEDIRRKGGQTFDPRVEGSDIRCIGLPPSSDTTYYRMTREYYDRHRAGRFADMGRKWDILKRNNRANPAQIEKVEHDGHELVPVHKVSVETGDTGNVAVP